ncbi:MAG: XdhC family protein, partial [Candidatus Cloacimonetes bacterium]|nr:XdhC family protein [Candidatus Cloacimonadota bacterium]
METPLHDLLQKAAENQKKGREFVMATVVVGAQKTPGRSGFKLIWYPDGTFEGTVGGGKLERLVLDKCAALLETGQNDFAEYDLTEEPAGIGVQCGGIAKVFFEYFPPLRKAYIFGAGHLCHSLLPILDSLGFHLVVIDNRPEFASRELLPEADEVHAIDYFAFLDDFHPVRNDAVIIFTHGHLYDFDILDMLCRKNIQVRYIGMIGSRDKVKNAVSRIK